VAKRGRERQGFQNLGGKEYRNAPSSRLYPLWGFAVPSQGGGSPRRHPWPLATLGGRHGPRVVVMDRSTISDRTVADNL
jgi:hypothetical protein